MGQKANPYALRLIIEKNWMSSYFARGVLQAEIIRQDNLIRSIINSSSKDVLSVKIERSNSDVLVFITTSNLSFFVNKNNQKLDILVEKMKKEVNDDKLNIKVNLVELKKLFSNAKYIANLISSRIESRTPFRVALRMAMSKALAQKEVKGIKIKISGRLDGSEIAKTEKVSHGKVPLSTLTSIIDFSQSEAKATYGKIGITVWIYKGKMRKNNFDYSSNFNDKRREQREYQKKEFSRNVDSQKNKV